MTKAVQMLKDNVTPKRWRWYHGAAFLVAAQAAAFSIEGLVAWAAGRRDHFELFSSEQRDYYDELKQARWTAPPWAFGPAWLTNNVLTIAGTLRVLNKPQRTKGRDTFLALQAASWLIFVAFNGAYVGLRSPINGVGLTAGMWALTIASEYVALAELDDPTVAWSLATLLAWTTAATSFALPQALWNHDDLYNVGPFAQPASDLVRA